MLYNLLFIIDRIRIHIRKISILKKTGETL